MNQPFKIGQYTLFSSVGRGSFGEVYFARSNDGSARAAKIIRHSQSSNSLVMLKREMEIQGKLNHPHLLKALDFISSSTELMIIMEWCDQGNLATRLAQIPETGALCQQHMLEIALGLEHLHSAHGVVHRDIKLENILIQSGQQGHPSKAMVSDYGLARCLNEKLSMSIVGTMAYAAPEILR